MKCPKCSGEMAIVSYDKIKVDRCISCGGLWFQPDELRALRDDIWMADYILDSGDKTTGKRANAISPEHFGHFIFVDPRCFIGYVLLIVGVNVNDCGRKCK